MKFDVAFFKLVIEAIIIPIMVYGTATLSELSKSVNQLNVQVGVLITDNNHLEKRIDKVEEKVFNSK